MDGAKASEEKEGTRKESADHSHGVRLSWEKQNEGSGPTCHGEVGEGGDFTGACSPAQAQLQAPGTCGVEEGREKSEEKRHGAG